jgi:hypothetical protein
VGYYRLYYAVCALLVLGVALTASYGFGRLHGAAARDAWWTAAQAETQRALFRASEDLAARARQVEQDRAALAQRRDDHEDAIRSAGPGACRPDDDELRAIRRRWGAP